MFACRVVIPGRNLYERAHVVGGIEDGTDQVVRGRNNTLANLIEGAFAVMGEGRQRLEPEHGAGSLQRVQPTEDGVDLVDFEEMN